MRQKRMRHGVGPMLLGLSALVMVCFSSGSQGTPKVRSTVKTDTLDVHAGASADSLIVKTLAQGDTVTVGYELSGTDGAWCAITEDGTPHVSGYVLCWHLEQTASSSVWRAKSSRTVRAAPKSTWVQQSVVPQGKTLKPASSVTAIIYVTSWCPYSKKARAYLQSLGVNLIEYDIEKDPAKAEEMKTKGGNGDLPFIDIEGILITGYGPEAIKSAVEKRRGL